jgi:hypothetical protein
MGIRGVRSRATPTWFRPNEPLSLEGPDDATHETGWCDFCADIGDNTEFTGLRRGDLREPLFTFLPDTTITIAQTVAAGALTLPTPLPAPGPRGGQ